MTALRESTTLVPWSDYVAAIAEALDLGPGFLDLEPAQQVAVLRREAGLADAEQASVQRRQAARRHLQESERSLPREARRVSGFLNRVTIDEKRRILDASHGADRHAELRSLALEFARRDGDDFDVIVASRLRLLMMMLGCAPRFLVAVFALLVKGSATLPAVPAPTADLPPPKQALPRHLIRCPNAPNVLAVGRTRHPAGTPTLRAA